MEINDLVFWTGIMADHAKFQINALSPEEQAYVQEAKMYHTAFQRYNEIARMQVIDETFLNDVRNDLVKFIEFKKHMIKQLLRCNLLINFTPSFINHMVNEAMEFLGLFNEVSCPEKTQTPATYIKIWIADASGHATSIEASLDAAETILIDKAQYYKKAFDSIYKKSAELEMIQNNVCDHYDQLKSETIQVLKKFIAFCRELADLRDSCTAMATGTFGSEIVNHFIKEHEYVITKLKTCM